MRCLETSHSEAGGMLLHRPDSQLVRVEFQARKSLNNGHMTPVFRSENVVHTILYNIPSLLNLKILSLNMKHIEIHSNIVYTLKSFNNQEKKR